MALLLAVALDVAGMAALLTGVFAQLQVRGRDFGDLLIYSGALLVFLSLLGWILWYTGNIEISRQELERVCHLVLVVLSLWPDRAVAPGPPSGSPRVSPDPRADLDSAVLLTRSLLADTRQLAAQMRDKFPADGDHNLDSLPTLAMSAGTLGSLQ
ncbi:hypothetical protein STEG23_013980, partial [Scotinomys teguina]